MMHAKRRQRTDRETETRSKSLRCGGILLLCAAALLSGGCRFAEVTHAKIGERPVAQNEGVDVEVVRAGQTLPVSPGTEIKKGDTIRTGPDVTAWLWFRTTWYGAGSEIILWPDSELHVYNSPGLFLSIGRLFARIRGSLRIETDDAVAEVEGTQFMLEREGNETLIQVLGGRLRCRSKTGPWKGSITAGQWGRIPQRGTTRVGPIERNDLNRLIRDVNRVERVVRPGSRSRLLVPHVQGLERRDASDRLRSAGLRPGQIQRRLARGDAIGTVLEQRPAGGSVARGGTEINLVVGARAVTVPSVIRMEPEKAVSRLQQAGLRGRVDRSETITGEVPAGRINRQEPTPHREVVEGTEVHLWVEQESVLVPDVTRRHEKEATEILRRSRLRARITARNLVVTPDARTVLDQDPAAGRRVAPQSTVNLTVARRAVTVPDVRRRPESAAIKLLRDRDLRHRIARTEKTDRYPDGTVLAQTPAPGQIVAPNTTIHLTVTRHPQPDIR